MRKSLIIRRPGSNNWYLNFQVDGRRFRDSTGTDSEAEANAIAAQVYAAAAAPGSVEPPHRKAPPPGAWTLSQALGSYWEARGAYVKTADDIEYKGRVLVAELGATTLLTTITFRMLSDYIARRRVRQVKRRGKKILLDRANASINREIGHLRTVLIHARDNGAAVPKIEWKNLWLDEPENYQNILSVEKEDQLFAELRGDFWPMIEFALISGMRLENVIGLTWAGQIDWDAKTISVRGKSRKPGGKLIVLPLTEALMQVINGERGKHPEFVFTFECKRNRHERHKGVLQEKGERYPFTANGWRREWDRVRQLIGLPKLRFHDLRHTAATRAIIAYRDLKVVKEMLGHSDIATTARYAHADTTRVREAMEASADLFGRARRGRLRAVE